MVRYFGKEPLDTDEQHVLKTAPKVCVRVYVHSLALIGTCVRNTK